MTVGSILAEKGGDIITIDGDQTLTQAITVLETRRVGALLIAHKDNPVAGILSERDIVRALSKRGAAALDGTVAEYMTSGVITVTLESTLVEAMEIMTQKRIRHLPVLEDGRVRGLVSIGDVVKRRIRTTEEQAAALKEYITTA